MAVTTMKKGAMDFIEKPFKEEELLGLVERMLDQRAQRLQPAPGSRPAATPCCRRLTTREAQVLERIVAGRLNKQIADDLGISIKTVEAHRANIMEKLNANTVADLLKIALGAQRRQGLTTPASRRSRPLPGLRAFSFEGHDRMTAQLIDGIALSSQLRAEVAHARRRAQGARGHRPGWP